MLRRVLLWLLLIGFFVFTFDLGMNHDVERFGNAVLSSKSHPDIEKHIPLGALDIVVRIRRRIPAGTSLAAWSVRKALSIVFFGIAGALSIALVRRGTGPITAKQTLVSIAAATLLSAIIELGQAPESRGDVVLDLFCGVLGGLGAAWLWPRRRTDNPVAGV